MDVSTTSDQGQKDPKASAGNGMSKSERMQTLNYLKAQPEQNLTAAQKLAIIMIEEIKSLEGEE
ncbi:MAG: hypothetical protein AAB544_00710 [Patescibacteria group bacterium]